MTMRDILVAVLLVLVTVLANWAIWLNGAATNPYAVLVLVPIAASMLVLPFRLAWLVVAVGVLEQVLQLKAALPAEPALEDQYRAVVYGLVLATLLLAVTLHILRIRIVRQQQAIRALHQRQHRDEQLVTIGTAAAQFSHEVATPIQTIQFMLEDARQRYPDDEDLQRAEQQIRRIHNLLLDWRQVAEDVRLDRVLELQVNELVQQVRDALLIARPDIRVIWHDDEHPGWIVQADRTLIPALLSLLHNAADAAPLDSKIEIQTALNENQWKMAVRSESRPNSTSKVQAFGGKLLSYATFERFEGTVSGYADGANIVTVVALPAIYKAEPRND